MPPSWLPPGRESCLFQSHKKAKRDHWSSFLASATPQTVWTVKEFAVGRLPPHFRELPGASTQPKLNKALLDHFFPGEPARGFDTILLPCGNCPKLTADEIPRG